MKLVSPPVRWNAPAKSSVPVGANDGSDQQAVDPTSYVEVKGWVPMRTKDCRDHPAVNPTSYMEVSDLLGTSGCSKHTPWWVSDVMGVIETERGRIVVNPGDWILEPLEGVYLVVSDAEYQKLSPDITFENDSIRKTAGRGYYEGYKLMEDNPYIELCVKRDTENGEVNTAITHVKSRE